MKDYVSFDLGSRVEDLGYTEFRDEAQFTAVARSYAARAASEVTQYRKLVSNVGALSKHLLDQNPDSQWPCYNAGIACALSGNFVEASAQFDRCFQQYKPTRDWEIKLNDDIQHLRSKLGDRDAFRQIITERVHNTRELMKLGELEKIDFDVQKPLSNELRNPTSDVDDEIRMWPIIGKPLEEILRRLGIS